MAFTQDKIKVAKSNHYLKFLETIVIGNQEFYSLGNHSAH
jgi:hypothetical protein